MAKGHMIMRILHSGPKAQNKGDSSGSVLQDPYLYVAFGPYQKSAFLPVCSRSLQTCSAQTVASSRAQSEKDLISGA